MEEIKQKLVCNTTIDYSDNIGLTDKINSNFKTIDQILKVKDRILVTGLIEIYGYQINNGFFDSINLTYYPETHEYIKNGTIINYSENKVKTLKR